MKKNKFIGLATLFLALGGLAGCCGECEHDYTGYESDDTNHWQVCTKCGEKLEGSEKKHSFKKNPDKTADNKAATCTEAGWEWKVCACGKEQQSPLKELGHSFSIKTDRSNVVSTTATCTEAGEATVKCSRCDATGKVTDAALDHAWVHDPAKTDIPASCTGKAVLYQKCSRCDITRIIDGDAALGHSYKDTQGTPEEGFATISTSACDNCNSARVFWNANEVTDHCKNDKRTVGEGEDAFEEPNYVQEGDGIRFWGRPIRNGIELSEEGRTDQNADHTPIYAPEIEGSFFEYKVRTTTKLEGARLIAEYEPTQNLIDAGGVDLYKGDSSDWTPGLTTDGTATGSKNLAFRYEVKVDNDTLQFDAESSNPCTSTEKAWFTFPTNAFTLEPGVHTIRISMAGGYLNTFYNFGFEVVDDPRVHIHNYVKDATKSSDPTCTELGHYYGTCSCGMVRDEPVPTLGHNYEADPKDTDKEATCLTDGLRHVKCSRCGNEDDQVIEASGHEFENSGDPIVTDGCAPIQKQVCKGGDVERYIIKATDVTEATKVSTRSDTTNNGTVEEPFAEPNYVDNGNGSVSFWGRAIHNKQNLSTSGSGTSAPTNKAELYDETVQGSFVEYKFAIGPAGLKGKLMMDAAPAQWQNNGMFAAAGNDWTPGLADAEGNEYPTRYVITLNGTVLEQDLSKDVNSGSSRTWYTVPLKNDLDLAEGEYTLRFTMANGYRASFYNFAIQTPDPEVEPVGPVETGIKLDVSTATGYNNKAEKCKSAGTWTIDHTAIEEGEYSVKLIAKCTSGDHGDRKFYNMAKAELCVNGEVEETRSNAPDTADQADYRYFLKVGNKVVNPDTTKSWGELGLDTNNYNAVEFVSKIIITDDTETISIDHGDIGFSLYIEGIELTRIGDHEHAWVDGATVDGVAGTSSTYKLQSCACGKQRAVISAAQDVNGKITKEGGKLGATGDTAKYVINVDAAITGTLKAKVSVDNAGNYGYSYYTGKNGGQSAVTLPDGKTNTEMKFNNEAVTMPTATYSEMGITGTDAAGAGIANFGEFTLVEGANEFTFTRLDSFGLSYYEFYFEF